MGVEVRFATERDGVAPVQVARKLTLVAEGGDRGPVLVRTRFARPTRLVADPVRDLDPQEAEALVRFVGYWSPQVAALDLPDATRPMPHPLPVRWVRLADLTVGQLTVDRVKVRAASWVRSPEDVVLCACRLAGELMIVDGSTRAVAAHLAGIEKVGVVLQPASSTQHLVRQWCRTAGLVTVADLASTGMVGPRAHRKAWLDRCRVLPDPETSGRVTRRHLRGTQW